MRVAVFGAGAVGSYFGARLAQAGESVAFIARGRVLEALQAGGLHVSSIAGDVVVKPAEATDDPRRVGPVDLVLLGVKAWQVPEAALAMKPLMGPDTAVLSLLNGVEWYDQLVAALGASHVLGGLCRVLAFQVEPGHVRHAAVEPSVGFGEWDGAPSERVARIKAAFDRCVAVKAQVPANIQTAVWEKFVFIAPFGGVGAATRAPAGVFRKLPETRALLEGLMHEVVALAHARRVPMRDDVIAKTLAAVDKLPENATASMQRDMMEGRPSELDAQLGAVVRLARTAGVPVPLTDAVYAGLLPLERLARGEIEFPS